MFVDLMSDIANTFTERFLRVQLAPSADLLAARATAQAAPAPSRPTKRFNALGIVEDIPAEPAHAAGEDEVMDIGPDEPPKPDAVTKTDPVITNRGTGRPTGKGGSGQTPGDWSAVGRNDPCPCGSGKKFKKCHGSAM
jgi:preprotein translocase subunit SecA